MFNKLVATQKYTYNCSTFALTIALRFSSTNEFLSLSLLKVVVTFTIINIRVAYKLSHHCYITICSQLDE